MIYNKLTGIILKKQNYKEADQIATVYTLEYGKIRCLAKSLRLSKSKLAGSFQDFSLVQIELATGHAMPILISAKCLESFNRIKTDLTKIALVFYAAELVIKLTADEQINTQAYDLLVSFLKSLNQAEGTEQQYYLFLDNFALRFLEVSGFSIEFATHGFKLSQALMDLTNQIQQSDYENIPNLQIDPASAKQIHRAVSEFIEYILERDIKSTSFLKQV